MYMSRLFIGESLKEMLRKLYEELRPQEFFTICYIVNERTKSHNSGRNCCSTNSFLHAYLHIEVVHLCKFEGNVSKTVGGVASTRLRLQTDGQAESSIPPLTTRCSGGIISISILIDLPV